MLALALVLGTLATAGCNDPQPKPIVTVATPGSAFQALPSADGCWVFASVPRTGNARNGRNGRGAETGGIAVYRRANGALTFDHLQALAGGPTGMTLTHDGRTLIVAAGDRVAFLDVERLTGKRDALLGYLNDGAAVGRIYANVTRDDRYLFIADENSRTVSVIDLEKARSSHYAASATIGKIPTGTLPIALTMSADEKLMYLTSQWAPSGYGWPIECKREAGNANDDPTPVNPQGAIHVVDVERAKTDPEHAIVADVPAGCSAVRLVLSPDGTRAYVTARNSNTLLVFDVAKLRSDRDHALLARVPVGTAPVGIAVTPDGSKVIVTNSNRFAGSADDHQTLTIVDARRVTEGDAAVIGSIAVGAFPRELRTTADGRTLILTNFGSQTIQMIDLEHLPMDPRR